MIDADAYAAKLLADNAAGRCFICGLADEATTPDHEIVAYRDESCVVFFPPWQRLYGYCLLAHRGVPAERLAGSAVELVGDGGEVVTGVHGQFGAFGEV